MLRDQVVGITPSDFRVLKIPDEKRSSDSTREREREREREKERKKPELGRPLQPPALDDRQHQQ